MNENSKNLVLIAIGSGISVGTYFLTRKVAVVLDSEGSGMNDSQIAIVGALATFGLVATASTLYVGSSLLYQSCLKNNIQSCK